MRKDIRLKDFKPDEHVLMVVRHHWFTYFRSVVGLLLLFVVPFFFLPFVSTFVTAGGGPVGIPAGFTLFFGSLWALILWNMFFARWTDLYYDVWIITNWRIIDIDQRGFFYRDTATLLTLEKIEDVTTKVGGVIGTILNYGSVQVQTAAAHREFTIIEVPDPRNVEKVIRRAQEVRLGLKPRT